ncbi:hypothetical protein ACTSKR_16380 [Chitinibacteraceae bacterium HSL-7]
MSRSDRRQEREARKQLLQLEAEMYRLELSKTLNELRQPFNAAEQGSKMLGLLRNPGTLLTLAGSFLGSGRATQLARWTPVVAGLVKVGLSLRRYLRRRKPAP